LIYITYEEQLNSHIIYVFASGMFNLLQGTQSYIPKCFFAAAIASWFAQVQILPDKAQGLIFQDVQQF
jgi:hypothetical protein